CCWGTWMVYVLPYVEEGNMFKGYVNLGGHDKLTPNNRYAGGVNLTFVSSQFVSTFTCPSDQQLKIGSITQHNYAVNAGNTSFFQINLAGATGTVIFGGAPFPYYNWAWTQNTTVRSQFGQTFPDG